MCYKWRIFGMGRKKAFMIRGKVLLRHSSEQSFNDANVLQSEKKDASFLTNEGSKNLRPCTCLTALKTTTRF